jgi:uncharacterized repeat protein (TIGR03803 family)
VAAGTAPAQTFTKLASLHGTDGANPEYVQLVQGVDGSLYGTTYRGGPGGAQPGAGSGTIFKISLDGTLTTLHNFAGTDGVGPMAGLLEA